MRLLQLLRLYLGNFNGVKIRHIHPLASILSHECSPNVKKYYTGISQGSNLQCKAAVDIKCGQKLTVSYIDLLLPKMIRQKILQEVRMPLATFTIFINPKK